MHTTKAFPLLLPASSSPLRQSQLFDYFVFLCVFVFLGVAKYLFLAFLFYNATCRKRSTSISSNSSAVDDQAPVANDPLDVEVRRLQNLVQARVQLVRDGVGVYHIKGSKKKILARVLNDHIMVRVGGGWQDLEAYVTLMTRQLRFSFFVNSRNTDGGTPPTLRGGVGVPISAFSFGSELPHLY